MANRDVREGHTCSFPATDGNGRVHRELPFATGSKGGLFATVEEITSAERLNDSYVGRVLRLTLLAPDIVEAILDGRQPAAITLALLMRPFSVGWREQQIAIRFGSDTPKSD